MLEEAWNAIGHGGERLATLVAMLSGPRRSEDDEEEDYECDALNRENDLASPDEDGDRHEPLDTRWPVREVFGDRLSPELDRWLDVVSSSRYAGTIRMLPGVTSTLGAAIGARDGAWCARLEGLFLPVAAILAEDEWICHASLLATQHGDSIAYSSHADDPGFHARPSLSMTVASLIEDEVESRGLTLSDDAFARLFAGARQCTFHFPAATTADNFVPDWPDHLSVKKLHPRTRWIVEHLLGIGYPDKPPVPGIDVWEAEQEHLPAWPHLQCYWLLHHLVFDNQSELAVATTCALRQHPAVAELADMAEQVLAGGPITAVWWDQSAAAKARHRWTSGRFA